MERKKKETILLLGGTFVFLSIAIYFFLSAQYAAVGICMGVYIALMGLEYLVSWLTLSKSHRIRPTRPDSFRGLATGPITPGWKRILNDSELKEAKTHRGVRHELFLQEREYAQGTWRFEIEVVEEKVVAWRRSFEATESMILDCVKQLGDGVFIRSFGD